MDLLPIHNVYMICVKMLKTTFAIVYMYVVGNITDSYTHVLFWTIVLQFVLFC